MQTRKNKPKQGKEKKKTKPRKIRVYNYIHKVGVQEATCQETRVFVEVVGRGRVCVCTAYVNQFSTEWARRTPKITKVQLATGSSFPWRHLQEGLWGKF